MKTTTLLALVVCALGVSALSFGATAKPHKKHSMKKHMAMKAHPKNCKCAKCMAMKSKMKMHKDKM